MNKKLDAPRSSLASAGVSAFSSGISVLGLAGSRDAAGPNSGTANV